MSRPVIALAGNPNSGKTTLFNRLTGADAKVGNYPGVTVERHEGALRLPSGARAVALDVPGTYSLSARTGEEQIAINAIAGLGERAPDLVVVVVDGTQLARNLYLVLQVLELAVPTVVAVNMGDVLARHRMAVDTDAMSRELGVPVVRISATRGEGVDELLRTGEAGIGRPAPRAAAWLDGRLPDALRDDLDAVAATVPADWDSGDGARRRALAAWALLSVDETDELAAIPGALRERALTARRAASDAGRDTDLELVAARYAWIDERMDAFLLERASTLRRLTDAADRLLVHPLLGFLLFLAVMAVMFQALFSWSEPMIDAVDGAVAGLGDALGRALPAGLLRDFVVDGLVSGVGAVLVFLPQILLLFLFIGIMEDSGYMARAALLMDRVMRAVGLTGRAFVPMLSGFACAIPAIMATRTMERHRDRMLTMMVVPLMTCSARLPVYTLIIAALFPSPGEPGGTVAGVVSLQAVLMVALYLFATLLALAVAAVLGLTIFKGPSSRFLLELPPYRLPMPRSVLRMMWQRARLFVTEAGTVILTCTVILWALLSFPRAEAPEAPAPIEASYGGRLGHALEPVFAPLGFDWKINVGIVGAFAAREVFVSTLGVVYGIEEEADEESVPLREQLQTATRADGSPAYTPLVGLSLMVFFAIAAQCMSTLAVVKRETRSWRWPVFLFSYMTALAWVCSFAVYQGGRLLGFS